MSKTYTLVLNCGYAEESAISFVPFTSVNKYANAREAVLDFAEFMKEQFNQTAELKKCCRNSKKADQGANFCRICGARISNYREDEFDEEAYMNFIHRVCQASCLDDFAGKFGGYADDERWRLADIADAKNIRVIYVAEKVLAAAIGYPSRDDRTFEVICEERTARKTEHFSFW